MNAVPNTIIIFGISIPLYSLFVFLGIIAFCATTSIIIFKREKIDKSYLKPLLLIIIPSLLVLYLSALLFNSLFHSIEEKKIVIGGITWLGGVVGLFPFLWLLFHYWFPYTKGKEFEWLSYLIPGIVLGHCFGRIGCFFGGCCFGVVTDSFLGVRYPEFSTAFYLYPTAFGYSQPVLPIQLFEAAFELVLFIVMVLLPKEVRKYNIQIYVIFYSVFRFIIEFFRGDDRGSIGFDLSPSQLISLLLIIVGIFAFLLEKGVIIKRYQSRKNEWIRISNENREYMINNKNTLNKLTELKAMYDKGIITDEEYTEKKKDFLDKF